MSCNMMMLCAWVLLISPCRSLVHVQHRELKLNGTTGLDVAAGSNGTTGESISATPSGEWLSCELQSEECTSCQERAFMQDQSVLVEVSEGQRTAFHNKNHVVKAFDGWVLPVNARAGEIWLVRTEDVHIQGRGCVSEDFGGAGAGQGAINAIAIGGQFLGGHVIIVETLKGHVTVDDKPMTEGHNVFATLYSMTLQENRIDPQGRTYNDVLAWLPKDTRLLIRRYEHHVDAKIYLSRAENGIEVDDVGQIDGKCNSRVDFEKHVDTEHMLFQDPVAINEAGYVALQSRNQHYRMGNFIRQLIDSHGATVLDDHALEQMIPLYSGEQGFRSWKTLLKALRKANWVRGFRNKL